MTVSSGANIVSAIGNGVTTVWPYSFKIPTGTIEVTLTTSATDVEGAALDSSLYSVAGLDDPNGGTVTYPLSGSPLASTHKINIKRIVPIKQTLDLTNQSAYFPTTLEEQLDLIVMMTAQLTEEVGRAVKIDVGADATPDQLLDNIVASKAAAAASESAAASSETNAAASELKASKWAEEAENVAVETGQFSAKHHALKAAASAAITTPVETQIGAATDAAFADADMLTARKNSDGSLLKHSWLNVKALLKTYFDTLYVSGDNTAETRNRIVNPAMQISQQNSNTAGTTSAYYGADQWATFFVTSAGTITTQRVQSVTPKGAKDRYRVTITAADASLAAGEFLAITQNLEGQEVADLRYGSASAKQAVLRFGFKGPAGTYAIALHNSAANRSYVALFTIGAGEANTDTVQTVTIAGDTTGTWLTDTGIGITLDIVLACGSTFQGVTGWQAGNIMGTSGVSNGMGTLSSVFELFDVGLHADPDATGVAPAWELPEYATELRRSSRYAKMLSSASTTVIGAGLFRSTTRFDAVMPLAPEMRIVPTLTVSNVADFVAAGAASFDTTGIGISNGDSSTEAALLFTTISGATAGQAGVLTFDGGGTRTLFLNARL